MKSWLTKLTVPPSEKKSIFAHFLPPWAVRVLNVLCYLSLPFFPLFCLLVMDLMNFGGLTGYRVFVAEHPRSLLFECLVMLVLFLALLLLFRKASWAAGFLGAFSLIFAYVNFIKVALNGDHFQPRDLTMISSLDGLMGFISGDVPYWFVLSVIIVILWVSTLAACHIQLPLRWFVRIPVLLVGVLGVWSMFSTIERSNRVLERFGMSFMDAALQTSNYRANGFVGAFTINILMGNIQEPEDYSQETIQSLMAGYTARDADPDAPEYDVIVVLSESFTDVRALNGVTFSENPLPNYDEILSREETYSGTMYSTASGGGTVRPEFDILTGLTTDYLYDVPSPYELVDAPVESFVSHYHDMGYDTVAVHPYDKTFYRRSVAYPYIGFDKFYGENDLAEMLPLEYNSGGHVRDSSTLDAMKLVLENADGPTFLLAITMGNHQPYDPVPEEEITIRPDAPALDPETLSALTTYTQGLAEADQMLGDLVDYIDRRDRPTVLLFFGDHIPSLGANRAIYYETGALGDDVPEEQQLDFLYSTPFLIYSNTGAVSGMLPGRQDNRISSYYLLEIIAEMTGIPQTPYMQLLADYYTRVPYYNIRLGLEQTPDIAALAHMHELISYDRLAGERYSVSP